MQTTTTTKGWQVLEEPTYSQLPKEALVLFARAAKGNPQLHFNSRAALVMNLQPEQRIAFLLPPSGGGLTIGLRVVEQGGKPLRGGGVRSPKALRMSTGALTHLAAYRRVHYGVRAGKPGEPAWVLEAVKSERVAQS